jgi:hypothetical protein
MIDDFYLISFGIVLSLLAFGTLLGLATRRISGNRGFVAVPQEIPAVSVVEPEKKQF